MSYWSLKNLLREAGWGRRLNMKMACWQRQPRLFQGIFPSSLELSLLLACGAPLPHHQNFADASPLSQTSSSSCSHSTPMRLVLKPCLTPPTPPTGHALCGISHDHSRVQNSVSSISLYPGAQNGCPVLSTLGPNGRMTSCVMTQMPSAYCHCHQVT